MIKMKERRARDTFLVTKLTILYRTTTELTTSFSTTIANLIGLTSTAGEGGVEVVVRAVCYPFPYL